jgi:hypothetical protein
MMMIVNLTHFADAIQTNLDAWTGIVYLFDLHVIVVKYRASLVIVTDNLIV